MKINWFPGHMTKSLRIMANEVAFIDVILYVLDSRAPYACLNPEFEKLIKDKPILFIFNKVDMADKEKLKEIVSKFNSSSHTGILIDSRQSNSGKKITDLILKLSTLKIKKLKQKGLNSTIKCMVIGVPNTGKSTLINNLCKFKKTTTGNKPGVTRGKQWLKVSSLIEVLDTPGTLWPSLKNEKYARYLAYIGSIKDDVLDITELAINFINDITTVYFDVFKKRYNIDTDNKLSNEILREIAIKRNYILKGGEPDIDRAAVSLIDDFRKGRLGLITLI